jgi:hypothetical protein
MDPRNRKRAAGRWIIEGAEQRREEWVELET